MHRVTAQILLAGVLLAVSGCGVPESPSVSNDLSSRNTMHSTAGDDDDALRAQVAALLYLLETAETVNKLPPAPIFVGIGEDPLRATHPGAAVVSRLRVAVPRVQPIAAASTDGARAQVREKLSGRPGVILFGDTYIVSDGRKAFTVGGTYANSSSIQRYIVELRKRNDSWAVWQSARWGGHGYEPLPLQRRGAS